MISSIDNSVCGPYSRSGIIGINIDNGTSNFFLINGFDLNNIVSVAYYPIDPNTISFAIRQIVQSSYNTSTFSITILDNQSDALTNRGGILSIRMKDSTTTTYPVITYSNIQYHASNPLNGFIT